MRRIDLHVHSNQSDGTLSPKELVTLAADCGLSAFALTDHDTVSGLPEAISAGKRCGVEVISGIEFSTDYLGKNIHIVGLDFDWQNPDFKRRIESIRKQRNERNLKIIEKMAADGIDISFDQMMAAFGDTIWTRANFARYLADRGYVPDLWSAFDTHIGEGCKYYVPIIRVSPFEITRLICRYNGIPVLAHPYEYHLKKNELITLMKELHNSGLIAVECWYSKHNAQETEDMLSLCNTLKLLPGGGSDFHGANKPDIALGTGRGNLNIPYEIFTQMREAKHKED